MWIDCCTSSDKKNFFAGTGVDGDELCGNRLALGQIYVPVHLFRIMARTLFLTTVDISSFTGFRRTVKQVDFTRFLRL